MAYGQLNIDLITGSGAGSVIINNGTSNVLGVTTGNNLQMLQNGGGIVFSNSSALTNSTLNDYETGTWTPTFVQTNTNPTVTYVYQGGIYTKIGKCVTINARLDISATSGGNGNVQINGLPFTSASNGIGTVGMIPMQAGGATAGRYLMMYINYGSSNIFIYNSDPSSASYTALSALTNSTSLIFSISYLANF